MSELLPCPFCGGEAKPYDYGVKHIIECDDCKEYGHGAYVVARTEAEAIAAWNTRHQYELTDEDYNILLDELGVSERTCQSTTDDSAWCFVCSECGKSFPLSKLHLAHNHGEINYCPNCGAKVVGE